MNELNTYYKKTVCKNCKNEFEGNFCNCCGQNSKVKRIDYNYVKSSIKDNVFQINHGFLYTVKVLLVEPGVGLKNFFLGKRKDFYKPFAFLIVSTAIFLLSTKLIGNETFIDAFIQGLREGVLDKNKYNINIIKFDNILVFVQKNQTYVLLFMVPLFSIASFISFRKYEYNLYEHLVFNLYITGEQLLFYSVFGYIINDYVLFDVLPFIFGALYNVYVYNRLFNNVNLFIKFFRFIITYFIYLFIISILVLVLFRLGKTFYF